MDRIELGKALNLKEELIATGRDNRPGTKIKPSSITVHNTDNSSRGADADAHSRFVRNVGYYEIDGQKKPVSWHFTVDDKQVIKQLPLDELAYHAQSGNRSSLAIEICMHAGIDQAAADERAAKLMAALLYDLGLDATDIRTHRDWTGKNCPQLLLPAFDAFKKRVTTILDTLSGPKGGLEFDALDLGLATDADGSPLFAQAFAALDAGGLEPAALDAEIDHEAMAKAVDAITLVPLILPSGEERIKKALELVKEGRSYPKGCSGFVAEVLGISWENANSLMGATPKELSSKPPYDGLKAGDIVGWKQDPGSGHVAIYYGKSDAEYFIDVRDENAKPRIKNGYYDRMLYKSSRF